MTNTRSLLLSVLVGLSTFASPGNAFMPSKQFALFGWMGYSHSQITHDALRTLTYQLYGYYQTDMMKQARRDMGNANAEVDHDFHTSQKHFDGESIPEAQLRIQQLRDQAIVQLGNGNVHGARVSFGQITHTLQDFYSHSNWIEMGNDKPHPEIGRNYYIHRLAADFVTNRDCTPDPHQHKCPNCKNNLVITQDQGYITTGYYSDETRIKPGDWKSSHGGEFDKSTTIKKGGINKDTVKCHMSPHGLEYHWKAIGVAREATRQWFLDLFEDITAVQVAALLGAAPAETIGFENPRVAGGAISRLKENGFLVKRSNTPSIPQFNFISTPISNIDSPSDIKMTTNINDFEKALESSASHKIKRRGGGEGDGMTLVMDRIPPGSNFLFFTDSDREATLEEQLAYEIIANTAAARNIKIFPISEKHTAGDEILARLTGGIKLLPKFLHLLTQSWALENAVTIFSSSEPGTFEIPVDSTITGLVFAGDVKSLKKPDGTEVDPDLVFNTPTPGIWIVESTGSVRAMGSSPLRIEDFEVTQYAGRPGHMGYFPVQSVLSGVHYTAVADVAGDVQNPVFALHAGDEKLGLQMARAENLTEVCANVTIPVGEYSLLMTGTDPKGHALQRQWQLPVLSYDHVVSVHGMILVDESNVAEAKVIIQGNRAGKGTLNLSVSNPAYKIMGEKTQTVTIVPGQESEVIVKVKLPSSKLGTAILSASLKGPDGVNVVGSRILPMEENIEWKFDKVSTVNMM